MPYNIFMIHGMWGGPWYWENYRNFLEAKGYRCTATTLRHHKMDPKDSPDPALGRTSLLDYAADLEAEIRKLGEPPIIMGHSMGGLLAQMLGSRGLAKALVLLTPASPKGIVALTPSVIKSFWSVLTKWGFWKKPHRQSFEEARYSMLNVLTEDQARAAYDRFVYESGRAAFEIGFWLLDSTNACAVDAAMVTCPVYIAAGGQDRITPASVVQKVHQKYESVSTFKVYPNNGHWAMSEPGWEQIVQDIVSWLGQKVK